GLTFTYLDPPTLTDVNPTAGPTTGGNEVTITGTSLATTHQVTFDDTPAAFTVLSDTTITATAPPHTAGENIPITVNTLGGNYTSNIYTYQDPPL
ncbi:IPT/TIG domain-containing protein, partial [Streptomyces sparsogenes]|uniref:IPT/TIG domain-containing protein n=1 Tax=Streptomyces sparsogenes TaxID=67365 RepID=UPI00332B0492